MYMGMPFEFSGVVEHPTIPNVKIPKTASAISSPTDFAGGGISLER
jgi:hypothetical protein